MFLSLSHRSGHVIFWFSHLRAFLLKAQAILNSRIVTSYKEEGAYRSPLSSISVVHFAPLVVQRRKRKVQCLQDGVQALVAATGDLDPHHLPLVVLDRFQIEVAAFTGEAEQGASAGIPVAVRVTWPSLISRSKVSTVLPLTLANPSVIAYI